MHECDNIVLHSCYDIDQVSAQHVSNETDCKKCESYQELLDDPALDGVMLITPNHLHHEQVIEALLAGKHVFIEKPLAVTIDKCHDIIRHAESVKKIVQVGHNTRKRDVFRKTKQLLEMDEIGKIVSSHAHISFDFGLGDSVPEWKKDSAKCPLLPMTQLGIHFVDTLQYLISPIVAVSCAAQSLLMIDKNGNRVIDSAAAILQFGNGVIGTLQSHYVTQDTYVVEIYGTHGKLLCYEDRIEMIKKTSRRIEKEIIPISSDGFESFIEEVHEFADCILHQREPETNAFIGLQNVAVIEAMKRSSEQRKLVRVEF